MASFGYNVKLGVDSREFQKGIKALDKSMQGLGNKLKKAGDDLKWISATAAAALVGIAKTSISFEDAWVGVTKTVEGTEEQLAKVRQEIIDMSKATGISKNEIAGVAQVAGQLGIATEDLSSFTKVMVDLGIATDMSAEEAAMSLARLANITQMSSKDYDRLGATITALGNNYAVTESEIVEMATRLASTGDLVGLNQAQIMALSTAMGSLGSEAEAGGTAMSKLFRKMQLAISTGNSQLEQFAKVSGMSVEEFKKAFEKDALGALNSFVKGLAKIEDSGGSAVATLDEMKLSEVRLSDAVLRLVGSGDLLDKTIATANQAWEENTALTNEASKRYDEVKYRWGQVKETLGELAIVLGNTLLPIAKKALSSIQEWVEGLTQKVSKMSSFGKENILAVLAVVASIAPALKIAGTSIQVFGRLISSLTSPAGLATAAIIALVGGFVALARVQSNEMYGLKGLKSTLEDEREEWAKLKQAREDAYSSMSLEITTTQHLADELKKVVDENGKVKEGYEQRAKFIVGELNKALGTEIKLNDGVIEGYQDLTKEIDKLIRLKKVEATLDAYKEEYATALKKRSDATKHLIELTEQYNEASHKAMTTRGKERAEAQMTMSYITQQIGEQKNLIGEYGYTIQNYEALQTASVEGTAEAIDDALGKMSLSYSNTKQVATESIDVQIAKQQEAVELLRQSYGEAVANQDGYLASVLQNQITSEEQQLTNLYNSLGDQTAVVKQMTPEQVAAFKALSTSNLMEYQKQINKLSPEQRAELERVTGVITSNASIPNASGSLAAAAEWRFGAGIQPMPADQARVLASTATTINSNGAVPAAAGSLGTRASNEFKTKADGTGAANNFVGGIVRGILSGTGAVGVAVGMLAQKAVSTLQASLREHSPSKVTTEIGEYFVEGFVNGIKDNQMMAIKSVKNLASKTLSAYQDGMMIDDMQGSIDVGTKVIYLRPDVTINTQELDSQKLDQIVRHVDQTFGAVM